MKQPKDFYYEWALSCSNEVFISDGRGSNYTIQTEIKVFEDEERVFLRISEGSKEIACIQLEDKDVEEMIKLLSSVSFAKQQVKKAYEAF